MQDCPLHNPLESSRRRGLNSVIIHSQAIQVFIQIPFDLAAQQFKINLAGFHHCSGFRVINQAQQQMLQRCEFMTAGVRKRERRMDGLLKASQGITSADEVLRVTAADNWCSIAIAA